MKRELITILISVLILTSCSTTVRMVKPKFLIHDYSTTSVKMLKEYSYVAIKSKKIIEPSNRARLYSFESDFIKYFDVKGRLIHQINYNSKDSFKDEEQYRYSNHLDTVYTLRRDSLNSEFKLYETKYFDSNGVATVNHPYDWKFYYEIVSRNKYKEVTKYYKLNNNGININLQYDFENKNKYELSRTHIDYFDLKGNIKRDKQFNPDGSVWSYSKCSYDKHNNIVKRFEYFPKRNNKYRNKDQAYNYKFVYTYNKRGDWIKRVEYLNNKLSYIVIREIEYY